MFKFKSFSPAVKSWLGYLPGNWDIITDNVNCDRNLNGGISLGDAYGFVNINMSTDKRKVFISSAMGDVQIDAFTGITISAPNGNVKIEGKNVEIVAGNNLTLKSGENVDKMRKFYKKDWNIMGSGIANAAKKTVLSEIKKHVQIVDLTLLRTFIDAVVKPIGGTMLIKSKRFMRLEAGKGSTSLPKQAYQKGSDKQKKIYDAKCDEMYVNDTVMSALNLMKWYEDTYNKTVRKLKVLEKDLHDQRAIFFRSIWAFEAKKGVVKFNGKKRGELAEIVDKQNDIIDAAKADNVDQAKIHPKLDKITFEKENLGVQEHIRLKASLEEFKATAERLAKEISEYTSSIKKMQDPNNEKLKAEIISISDKENRIFEEAMIKDTICHYLEIPGANGTPSPKKRISTLTDNIFTFKNSKEKWISPEEKRQIIYYVLNALKEQNKVTIKNESDKNTAFLDHKQNLSTLDVSVCEDPQTWKDYLDCVKPYEKGTSTEDKISSFLSEYVLGGSLEHWSENFLYDPEIEGEILLSDTGGNTCKINGETISSIPTSSIKAAIGILKNI